MGASKQPRLWKGPYRGDVSALCLLSIPHRRLLLAGSGPHLLLYDLVTGASLRSINVFDGVRVHGICSGRDCVEDKEAPQPRLGMCPVIVHGERRVKVFEMKWGDGGEDPQIHWVHSLPRFSHWVLDVRLLMGVEITPQTSLPTGAEDGKLLAVGLSNNTICVWDLRNFTLVYNVECSERCLLYSMRLSGDSLSNLRAGAGTVFNEVLIWKLGSCLPAVETALTQLKMLEGRVFVNDTQGGEVLEDVKVENDPNLFIPFQEIVDPLQRLTGHEGSIHRLTWSSDGLCLVSVSDDRSARVWFSGRRARHHDPWVADVDLGPVLYGHGARLWDCHVAEKLLITASEDCTCCVWAVDGKLLATLKGHMGRGIWRCVYDPEYNIIVTAGADSSVKVQSLDKWVLRYHDDGADHRLGSKENTEDTQSNQDVFCVDPLWTDTSRSGSSAFMDSKSEYVRCLGLSCPWSLYVGTNQGYVYHVKLLSNLGEAWTTLIDDLAAPVVCMDVLIQGVKRGEIPSGADKHPEDTMIVVGDGRGKVSVLQVISKASQWHCTWRCTWIAEKERQLLGVYWCKQLGRRYVFTTDPRGSCSMWRLPATDVRNHETTEDPSSRCFPSSTAEGKDKGELGVLVAHGKGSNGRTVCISGCTKLQILVCGDKQGNLTVYTLPTFLIENTAETKDISNNRDGGPIELAIVALFRGAHGISAVTSVSIRPSKHDHQAEILSTGRDGCICRFVLSNSTTPSSQGLFCSGIEKVPEVSMVERLKCSEVDEPQTQEKQRIAAGFTGSDFLLWDTTRKCELMRVTCGGWRRPYAFIVGGMADVQQCFVFVKDQAIQVYRNWVTSSTIAPWKRVSELKTQSLRGQFHGKEINSVLFFSCTRDSAIREGFNQTSKIVTGSEDGTVIITSYSKGMPEQLDSNLVLGDHVGGSAVRSLSLIAEVHHTTGQGLDADTDCTEIMFGGSDEPQLLFSAGAKEVLTCWLLDWISESSNEGVFLDSTRIMEMSMPLLDEQSQNVVVTKKWKLASQWLSTRMPQRLHPPPIFCETQEQENTNMTSEVDIEKSMSNDQETSENFSKEETTSTTVKGDDDQRYLALTAFGVKSLKSGSLICFVVTASSNATLQLHVFHVAKRSWIELAVLNHKDAPVLTIKHIVAPCSNSLPGLSGHVEARPGQKKTGTTLDGLVFHCHSWICLNKYLCACDAYIILAGATNGRISVWDITSTVLDFMKSNHLDLKGINPNALRPLAGRGSQGGRRRRTKQKLKEPESLNGKKAQPEVDAAEDLGSVAADPASADDTSLLEDGVKSHLTQESNIREKFKVSSSSKVLPSRAHWLESNQEPTLLSGRRPRSVSAGSSSTAQEWLLDSETSSVDSTKALILTVNEDLDGAHQSGVNCMSVTRIHRMTKVFTNKVEMVYVIVSGGDDQALHLATVKLEVTSERPSSSCTETQGSEDSLQERWAMKDSIVPTWSRLKCSSRSTVPCAHSSAVKGVWTDGLWVFSTGLDQRLRCWRMNTECFAVQTNPTLLDIQEDSRALQPKLSTLAPLVECKTCVIDVPEAASLDVTDNQKGQYQIAVVGRGLQVINFDSESTTIC